MNISIVKETAIKKAAKSICRYKISAVAFDKVGNYIGCSRNAPFLSKWHGGRHAELTLMRRYGAKIKTIVICRVSKLGQLLPIHPCSNCKKVADKLGIKIVSIQELS